MIAAGTYIARETALSIVINAGLSLVFFWLIFGFAASIKLWGLGQYVLDFVPQSFLIALMSTIVPGLVARKKLLTGAVQRWPRLSPLPSNLLARAVLLAVLAAILGTVAVALLALSIGGESLAFWPALWLKVLYGGLLAALVTPLGLRAALARHIAATSREHGGVQL